MIEAGSFIFIGLVFLWTLIGFLPLLHIHREYYDVDLVDIIYLILGGIVLGPFSLLVWWVDSLTIKEFNCPILLKKYEDNK